MKPIPILNEIKIRNRLRPGDLGYIIYLHASLYKKEFNYDIGFEIYVAAGLTEFYNNYDPEFDGIWICEHQNKIVGSLFLVHQQNTAQLRYFLIEPAYRGIGLGNMLMQLVLEFLKNHNYNQCFLWTTDELKSAAAIYLKFGFRKTEEKESSVFGKKVIEQRYDLKL